MALTTDFALFAAVLALAAAFAFVTRSLARRESRMIQEREAAEGPFTSKVRTFYSLEADLETYRPSNPEDFCIGVDVEVCPEGDTRGADLFRVIVCTPQCLARALEEQLNTASYVYPRHYLVVRRYDYDAVRSAVLSRAEGVHADTWNAVGYRINRWMAWEFEDY